MSSFIKNIIKSSGNDLATLADGELLGDVPEYIDTGNYAMNALMSGSIYRGLPSNKITCICGESATGKTYYTLGICANFQKKYKDSIVVYFDSEHSLTKDIINAKGLDLSRTIIIPIATTQDVTTQATRILTDYINDGGSESNPKLMIVLDSLGMLSTSKEVEDSFEGNGTKDMTRAQEVKKMFRVLTLKLGKANVPMIVTNHVYSSMSMYGGNKMSGGSGIKYAASTIVELTKAQVKDGTERVGNIITLIARKSRFTKEFAKVKTKILYTKGLDPYFGLLEIADEGGIFKKDGKRYVIDGKKVFGKTIMENPEKYFTDEVLQELDKYINKTFCYGDDE